jgi:hypothetical protein
VGACSARSGGCGVSCSCKRERGSCGGRHSIDSGAVPLSPDYRGEIWASPVAAAAHPSSEDSVLTTSSSARPYEVTYDTTTETLLPWILPLDIFVTRFPEGWHHPITRIPAEIPPHSNPCGGCEIKGGKKTPGDDGTEYHSWVRKLPDYCTQSVVAYPKPGHCAWHGSCLPTENCQLDYKVSVQCLGAICAVTGPWDGQSFSANALLPLLLSFEVTVTGSLVGSCSDWMMRKQIDIMSGACPTPGPIASPQSPTSVVPPTPSAHVGPRLGTVVIEATCAKCNGHDSANF